MVGGVQFDAHREQLRLARTLTFLQRAYRTLVNDALVRALLVEVREDLKAGEGEILADADADTDAGAVPDAPDAELTAFAEDWRAKRPYTPAR